MAWIAVRLGGTLVDGEPGAFQPVPGAVEAMTGLADSGHRLTVYPILFSAADRREEKRQQVEQELAGLGFPPMEVWSASFAPPADVFVGDRSVTFDGDWGLALAQVLTMLRERDEPGRLPVMEGMVRG